MEQMRITDLAHKPLAALSGGMRQNVYIAMALAQSTDYVLLDEPTTYLDMAHQLELMKTLRSLADSGKGIIAVTHDIQMAFTFSDRIILLHDGTVFDHGTPEEVCGRKCIDPVMGISLEKSGEGYTYRYR
jgi:iron complex transport system ATP-binding protein